MEQYKEEPDTFAYINPLSIHQDSSDIFKTCIGWQSVYKQRIQVPPFKKLNDDGTITDVSNYEERIAVNDVERNACIFTGMACEGDCTRCLIAFEPQFSDLRAKIYKSRQSEISRITTLEVKESDIFFTDKYYEKMMPKKYIKEGSQ